ncbi:MAG: hypothetical protein IKA36_07325 [Clostridia bacterium]|nr:hypothetical protein [Clostridia bacterium]
MKKFIGTAMFVFSTMMVIATTISSFVLGGKTIITLIGGVFDVRLIMAFIISSVLMSIFFAVTRIFGDMCGVEVGLTDSEHPHVDDNPDE